MKILMLTPYLPYPLYSGGQIRTYNLLKHLSRKHEITLFSFIRDKVEESYVEKLKDLCKDVRVFVKRPPWSPTSLALSAITVYPLVVCMYLQKSLKKQIEELVSKKHFDLIHAETFYVMPNIPKGIIPTILVEQTIEYLVYQHFTETVRLLPLKFLMDFDVRKIRYWEETFWKRAKRVVAMSTPDKTEMKKIVPALKVDLVPNGVDTTFFKMHSLWRAKNQTVLFVGNFKWLQNREAVEKLVCDIWPLVLAQKPQAKLWIVGRSPPQKVINNASDSIKVSSDVKDIRQAYYHSNVLLAPIFGPGGTRYKILESMASGLPVVTTTTGIEGIGATNQKDALISDDSKGLAQETVKVLNDKLLYKKLALNSRSLVEKRFSWSEIAKRLDTIYQDAAHESRYKNLSI